MGAPRVLLQITGVGRAAGGVTFNVKVAMESGPCKEVQCFFPLGEAGLETMRELADQEKQKRSMGISKHAPLSMQLSTFEDLLDQELKRRKVAKEEVSCVCPPAVMPPKDIPGDGCADLQSLSRKDLVKLAKTHEIGISGNRAKLIERLQKKVKGKGGVKGVGQRKMKAL